MDAFEILGGPNVINRGRPRLKEPRQPSTRGVGRPNIYGDLPLQERVKLAQQRFQAKKREEKRKETIRLQEQKIREQQIRYYITNRDKINEQRKQKYIDNRYKIKVKERNKQYRIDNREKIKEQKNQKITCLCSCKSTRSNFKRHIKSKNHKNLMSEFIKNFISH